MPYKTGIDAHKRLNAVGCGTGINLDTAGDPVEHIRLLQAALNEIDEARPAAAMFVLSAHHPRIGEFVRLRVARPVSTSVLLRHEDMANDNPLRDIAAAVLDCGQPGVIFVDAVNEANPLRDVRPYEGYAPCAEMGLAPGDSCVFATVNVAATPLSELVALVGAIVKYLDHVIDRTEAATGDINQTRSIGISICGLADLFEQRGVSYGSAESVRIARHVMSTVTYGAKLASYKLALEKRPFPLFSEANKDSFVSRYANEPDQGVSLEEWERLDECIRRHGTRNCTVTAIPPTGRSSTIIGASFAIEPKNVSDRECCTVEEEIRLLGALQALTDQAISKTVSLGRETSVEDVVGYLRMAEGCGVKGVSLYRARKESAYCV